LDVVAWEVSQRRVVDWGRREEESMACPARARSLVVERREREACSPGEEALRPGPKMSVLGWDAPRRLVCFIFSGWRMVAWRTSLKLGVLALGPLEGFARAKARSWKAALERIGDVSGRKRGGTFENVLTKSDRFRSAAVGG
jgi:hypothetical protein